MAYAPQQRPYYDADSHIMELPDFLKAYADPEIRDEIPSVSYSASVVTEDEVAVIMDQGLGFGVRPIRCREYSAWWL